MKKNLFGGDWHLRFSAPARPLQQTLSIARPVAESTRRGYSRTITGSYTSEKIGCCSKAAVQPERLLIRPALAQDFGAVRAFLEESAHLYPEIDLWWKERVVPQAGQGRRVILVVDDGKCLQGLFIGKRGPSAKICTLRLREMIRRQGIGRSLVTEGFLRLLTPATNAFHVTVSEGAEEGIAPFLESIGFRQKAVEHDRYREGLDEFVYSCLARELAEVLRDDLAPGLAHTMYGAVPRQLPCEQTLIMSLRPDFAELVLTGRKTVEFRRKFSTRYQSAAVVFYVTNPVRELRFTAKIAAVEHACKDTLWSNYHAYGGVSRAVFDNYFSGTRYGFAIRLENIAELPSSLQLNDAKRLCPHFHPPQSFQKLAPESPLVRALDLRVSL